jgi:hypothetical protein
MIYEFSNCIFCSQNQVILLQICHFLSYVYIISGRTFWQECPEDDDDDILILDVDEDLMKEMDDLISDLKL